MRVCLASAPTITELSASAGLEDMDNRRAQLGVLVLAAALERRGFSPEVVNLDVAYGEWAKARGERAAFPEHVADQLASLESDVYGLGTICSSYPATLRLAAALKQRRPSALLVLGGPQATATDVETLEAFAAVDVVVRGEADVTFPELVATVAAGGDWSSVRGISHRDGASVRRTPDAPLVEELDALPTAAYHLCSGITREQSMPVEAGRGCPFACSFCSTSRYFGRRFRMRSPARIVEDMIHLRRTYGIRRFDLVHDNFTVDRRRVLAFCEAIEAAGGRFSWTCSSRCDSMDEELLHRMWRTGCRGLFFGVESGSAEVQRRIGKRLDLDQARRQLRAVGRRRMPATASFMAGFPGETPLDLRATVELYVDALRSDSLEPQLSLLAPLPGTPIHAQHRGSLHLEEIVSDMSYQGVTQPDAERALVARYPDIFASFYTVPNPMLDRRDLNELRCFLHGVRGELRWLFLSAARICGGGEEAFRAFRAWRRADLRARSALDVEAYYKGGEFRRQFIRFARQDVARTADGAAHALAALAVFTASLVRQGEREAQGGTARTSRSPARGPALAPDLALSRIGCDGGALLRCVKRGGDLSRVPRRETGILSRRRKRRIEVLHVGGAAAELLALCDGSRDERSIARAFAGRHPELAGVPGARVCAIGLESFLRKGLVVPEA